MKFLRAVVLTVVAALGLTACAPAPGSDQKIQVIAAFYPLQFLAERIGGDQVDVTTLTQPGGDPHDLELTAQQLAAIGEADLVVYQKGFQPAVDKAIEATSPERTLDVSSLIEMLDATADPDGEEHADSDPHTWLYPGNMAKFAEAIGAQLGAIDPDRKDTFTTAAGNVVTELNTLKSDFTTGLARCDRREFITAHAAFAYLAHHFDLTQIGIAGLDPTVEPTTARIAEIHVLAKKYGVTTIFYETLTSPAVAKAIAGDLGLKTDVLDPLEGITGESRGTDYLEIMRANLTALRTANGCK